MRGFRAGIAGGVVVLATLSHAEPAFLDVVKAKYGLGTCQTCHTTPPQRNPFGRRVEQMLKDRGSTSVTEDMLTSLEAEDSDGDGASNGDELRQGGAPGVADGTAPAPGAGLIPSHAFHPLAVHFPIGLFLFGAFLDAIGARRRDAGLRRLAVWNLGFGAMAGVLAVGSGLASFFMKGLTWEGLTLWHPVFAIAACLAMLVCAWLKYKQPEVSGTYWGLLALAVALLTVAGHLGATIVYG